MSAYEGSAMQESEERARALSKPAETTSQEFNLNTATELLRKRKKILEERLRDLHADEAELARIVKMLAVFDEGMPR